jgi:tRNA(Ile)-lysidine synthetase-like protein
MGGTLIRRVIRHLRTAEVSLPLTPPTNSHILIACSGGVDSTALAVLVAKYGRKIVHGVSILHVNHGWRGRQSDADARFVQKLAVQLGVPCIVEKLDPSRKPQDRSWEEWGRTERKRLYARHAGPGGFILTGHQADEVCETLLWRLLTGSAETHGRGILTQADNEIRPLLPCFKAELASFLKEEGISWREDPSNADPKFLRASFRTRLRPILDEQFPRWKEHLLRLASESPAAPAKDSPARDWLAEWFGGAGVRMRRVHWNQIHSWLSQIQGHRSSRPAARDRVLDRLQLEDGWNVRLEVQEGDRTPRIVIEQDCK